MLDDYQLRAKVTGAVVCAWLDRWVSARRHGDRSGVCRAVGALTTTHSWRMLHKMQASGDYPTVVWHYADAVAANAPIAAGNA